MLRSLTGPPHKVLRWMRAKVTYVRGPFTLKGKLQSGIYTQKLRWPGTDGHMAALRHWCDSLPVITKAQGRIDL